MNAYHQGQSVYNRQNNFCTVHTDTWWVSRGRMVVVSQTTTPPAKGFASGLLMLGASLLAFY